MPELGHERPIDGESAVSALPPIATKPVRATNAALGHKQTPRRLPGELSLYPFCTVVLSRS
jgi:hypothetical protein